MTATMT